MSAVNVSDNIQKYIEKEMVELLKDISIRYGIEYDDLVKHYLSTPQQLKKKPQRKTRKKEKEEFIEMEEMEYMQQTYLVDKNNNVYTNNTESPMVVGERLVDGTIKLFKQVLEH